MPRRKPPLNWDEIPLVVDPAYVAWLLHYKDVRTVYRKAQSGEMPFSKIGREWRITKDDLKKYLDASKVQNISA